MCRPVVAIYRHWPCAAFLAVGAAWSIAFVSCAVPANAQTVAEYRTLVDSLSVAASLDATRKLDSTQRARTSVLATPLTDTARAGDLVVLTDATHAKLARTSAELAWPDIQRVFGAHAAALASSAFVLTHAADARSRTLAENTPEAVNLGIGGANGVVRYTIADYAVPQTVANDWRVAASRVLSAALSPDFRRWLGRELPVDSLTATDWRAVRVELITATAVVAHDCERGVIARCAEALGLVPTVNPLRSWYDAAGRRSFVKDHSTLFHGSRLQAAYARCSMNDGAAAACDSLADLVPTDEVPPPAGAHSRSTLTQLAITLGGPGAFDRLTGTTGSVAAQLASAAGVPADSLVSLWRANVMGERSSASVITPITAAAALFWACVCGALSLRSSRWR